MTIRELLGMQLEGRAHVTGRATPVEDIFAGEQAAQWIRDILGKDQAQTLEGRIKEAQPERLSHAAASYLLGIGLRRELDIRVNQLPRFISLGTGDAFHFFWAVICLGHDLGYGYERSKSRTPAELAEQVEQMNTSAGRKALLNITEDLLEVNADRLRELHIDPDGEDGRWVLRSIDLVRRYDRRRRLVNEPGSAAARLDHGICGGLILYDILYKEYQALGQRRRVIRRQTQLARTGVAAGQGAFDGFLLDAAAKDASLSRFAACCLIIACTVARHNVWLPESEADRRLYEEYDLRDLMDTGSARIDPDKPQEQLLFLLDFVDTIDPVKAFYTHVVEKKAADDARKFLLDQIEICFDGDVLREDRDYRRLTVRVKKDRNGQFAAYAPGIAKLHSWLDTKAPVCRDGNAAVDLYFPVFPVKKTVWPAGISDQEVDGLLLYMGAGVPGKYGHFYSRKDAYQTLNLLLTPGLEGEEIRVCQENRRPDSIYIRQWKMTLETLTDIFTAQCKYARHCGGLARPPLSRGDRGLSFRLMRETGATFSMTSTSVGDYLEKFLEDKGDPCVLEIRLGEGVPYFDYEGFFGDQYVYAEEREFLLPPFAGVTVLREGTEKIPHHEIMLQGFRETPEEDLQPLYRELEAQREAAAAEFDRFLAVRNIQVLRDGGCYRLWKEKFRRLCRLSIQRIYQTYYQ